MTPRQHRAFGQWMCSYAPPHIVQFAAELYRETRLALEAEAAMAEALSKAHGVSAAAIRGTAKSMIESIKARAAEPWARAEFDVFAVSHDGGVALHQLHGKNPCEVMYMQLTPSELGEFAGGDDLNGALGRVIEVSVRILSKGEIDE